MTSFTREFQINQLRVNTDWDVIIIGGGATGLGTGLEAATRGLKTLVIEQHDFAKSTSSRSTKLVHGGVRYLAQGNIGLVLEALHERGLMKRNAPHLVKDQKFIIASYNWWSKPFYTIGLTLYDLMAGRLSLGRSLPYSRKHTLNCIPTLKTTGLNGGVVYHDGQFDDARYAINLFQTIIEKGGVAINYMQVTGLTKTIEKISGVKAIDLETGTKYEINAKVVINATGIFVDDIIKMDNPDAKNSICVSQGLHLVLDKEFIPNDFALMIPKTKDGRVLFAVPWHNKVVVGTTDVKKDASELEPKPLEEEVDFILETAGRFLEKAPQRTDVKSMFAGLRPLASPKKDGKKTKEISRSHKITVAKSGLVTITGGKWTTYRLMAEDVMNTASKVAKFAVKKSVTSNLRLHGWQPDVDLNNPLYVYGSDAANILEMVKTDSNLGEYLSEDLQLIKAQVVWAIKNEMARTVEDVLARRTRALLLDAKDAVRIAPEVAKLMAYQLNYDNNWITNQIKEFELLAKNYILR